MEVGGGGRAGSAGMYIPTLRVVGKGTLRVVGKGGRKILGP